MSSIRYDVQHTLVSSNFCPRTYQEKSWPHTFVNTRMCVCAGVDVNECHSMDSVCPANTTCVNAVPGHFCSCKRGYERRPRTQHCRGIYQQSLLTCLLACSFLLYILQQNMRACTRTPNATQSLVSIYSTFTCIIWCQICEFAFCLFTAKMQSCNKRRRRR